MNKINDKINKNINKTNKSNDKTNKNNDKTKQRKENMWLELCLWTLLCACVMAVMLSFAANKTIVIADVSPELSGSLDGLGGDGTAQGKELLVQKTSDTGNLFYIPLPKGIKAENVMVENHYIHGELWLGIQCGDESFYEENALTGNTGAIREGRYELQEEGVLLKLEMQRVMEYRSTLKGDVLEVACYAPGELYDCVVVLDPVADERAAGTADGQAQAENAALSIARMVQKNMALEGVRIYLTRAEGAELSEEGRLALTQQVGADLYIGICVSRDEENPDKYGILCYYNQDYFISDFGNVQLADILTRETAIASSNRALGLDAAERDSLLGHMKIPAAILSVGYLSNPQERELLGQENYQEKLAEGILKALSKAYRELEIIRTVQEAE